MKNSMKKVLSAILLILGSSLFAKPVVALSILPQESFVKKIAKDRVDIITLVAPGSSPHSYEPKPSQMKSLSNAAIYFTIGVEFEEAWLARFQAQNRDMLLIDMNKNITKIPMAQIHHEEDEDEHEHHHDHGKFDPHTWTAPKNVAIMAKNIYEALVVLDPKNSDFYAQNLRDFLSEIDATNATIKNILKESKNRKFMVFHPSWGYFAAAFDLEQIALEIEGKNPKPKEIISIIKEAKEHNIRTIFTQPEFSQKSASVIAKETNAKLHKISPLSPKWSQNLINMATAIAE